MTNIIQKSYSHIKDSIQELLHKSRDDKYNLLAVMLIGESGTNSTSRVKLLPDGSLSLGDLAFRLVEDGTDMYIGEASIGSATSSNVWKIKKLDTSSGIVTTWADGNSNYDNVWDNYASLSYS